MRENSQGSDAINRIFKISGVVLIALSLFWISQRIFIATYYPNTAVAYPKTKKDAGYIYKLTAINSLTDKQLRTEEWIDYKYNVQGNEYVLSIEPDVEPMIAAEVLFGSDPADALVKDLLVSPILIIICFGAGSMLVFVAKSFN